jgi:hypothetical protein
LTISVASAALVLAGCFSARKSADKALDRVQRADEAGASNRVAQVEKAAAFVHGTGRALAAETNRTPAVSLAYDLNTRAETVLGAPRYQDAVTMENIVRGALSPLVEEQRASREALARIDGQVAGLQKRMDGIQREKGKAEDARDDRFLSFASEADTWRGIKRWLWIGGGCIGLAIVLPIGAKLLSVAFPAFAPLTSIFAGILALPGKIIMRIIPEVKDAAGVVAKEAHDAKEKAALHMVGAIEALKTSDPAAYARLKPLLLTATDQETQDTIKILKPKAPRVKT